MIPRPYHGSYSGEKGHEFLRQAWIIALAKSVEIFLFVAISDMPTITYWQTLEKLWLKQKKKSQKNVELVNHVSHHWQLLEETYTQDMLKI